MLLRVLTVVLLMIVSATAGFFIPRLLQYPSRIEFKYKFADQIPNPKSVAANVAYECSAITQAEVYENRLDNPTGNAGSGKGGDEVALKISSDGKGILVSFPYAATNDTTDVGEPIPIASQSESYVVASRAKGPDVVTVILDLSTLKAVYSYSGQGLAGIRGRSLLLACH
jgi:hypothetical protein